MPLPDNNAANPVPVAIEVRITALEASVASFGGKVVPSAHGLITRAEQITKWLTQGTIPPRPKKKAVEDDNEEGPRFAPAAWVPTPLTEDEQLRNDRALRQVREAGNRPVINQDIIDRLLEKPVLRNCWVAPAPITDDGPENIPGHEGPLERPPAPAQPGTALNAIRDRIAQRGQSFEDQADQEANEAEAREDDGGQRYPMSLDQLESEIRADIRGERKVNQDGHLD